MSDRDELNDLRRLAELEAKARGAAAPNAQESPTAAPQPGGPLIDAGALADTIKDVPRLVKQGFFQTVQGFMDLPVGAVQLASKALPKNMEDAVSEYMRERERQYAPLTGAEERPGEIQPGRVGGNVAFGIGMSPDKTPASLWDRMKAGAKTGGMMGLLAPVDPDNPNYWTTKTAQTGVSAGLGFIAPPVIEGIVRGAAAAANWLGTQLKGGANVITGQTRPVTVESKLEIELQRNGVDWSKLPQQMRDQLVGEVQGALKNGGNLDPAAVRRMADFARLGIRPTQGQVTRDPYQWGNERNLGKTEMGRPIAQRLNEQNGQMIDVIDSARTAASPSPDAYDAGKVVISSLRGAEASQKAGVDAAYKAARETAGLETDVPLQPVAQRIGQLAEEFGDDKIPAAVMKRLNEFGVNGGTQTRVFNIREAEKLKTLIGNNIDNPQTPTGKALTLLKQSVDDAINTLGDDTAGGATAAAFRTARESAAARFTNLRQTPALAEVADRTNQLTPERFIEQHFVRGDVDSVNSVMRQIPSDGRAEVQAGVLDWIRRQAVLGEGDTAQMTAAGIKKALDTIGDRKLQAIFDTETLANLMALKRVAAYIDRVPKSSGYNTSGSATTLIDALDKASKLPLVGAVVGKPGDLLRASQVVRALDSAAPVQPATKVIAPELVDQVAKPAGLLTAPTFGSVAPGFFGLRQKVNRNDERRQ